MAGNTVMRPRLVILVLAMCIAAFAAAQTSRPSTLELRAVGAFNSGDYATALPLLQKVVADLAGQPDRAAPLEEMIRVCRRQLSDAQAQAADQPRPPADTDRPRKPHEAPTPGEVRNLTIKDLGNFDYDSDKGGNIPADVLRLNGMTVRLTGFMIPLDQADNITEFALVPDLFACCFGQPPQVHHTVVVRCPKTKAARYTPEEIQVQGTLTVREKREEGYIVSLFELSATSVRAAPR